jgi:hypothetical protein
MKLRHSKIEIPTDEPFKNCKLDRKKYANALTSILTSFSEGFVLALNNKWGTGKTTFVEMWRQDLENQNFKTLYFNAWENDFESDPLVALMSELKTLKGIQDQTFKSLIKNGAKISQKIIPLLIKAIAEKCIETKVITEAIEKITDSSSEILKDEIIEYADKKKSLKDFKDDLEKYIKDNNNDKPLIFFVDELDRCKPTYAIDVLEKIKHFFSVPGIVFILSIDKVQLINSVKGFYGSEQIDGEEYLRRFINVEFNLPTPETGLFSKYLFDYYNFSDFFNDPLRIAHYELQNDAELFLKSASIIFTNYQLTLRQQEHIFSQAKIVISSFPKNNYVLPSLILFLIFLREYQNEIYNSLRLGVLLPQEVVVQLEKIFPEVLSESSLSDFIRIEALLILSYYNFYRTENYGFKISEINSQSGEEKLLLKSTKDISGNDLASNFIRYRQTDYGSIKITYLLDKIDLFSVIIS